MHHYISTLQVGRPCRDDRSASLPVNRRPPGLHMYDICIQLATYVLDRASDLYTQSSSDSWAVTLPARRHGRPLCCMRTVGRSTDGVRVYFFIASVCPGPRRRGADRRNLISIRRRLTHVTPSNGINHKPRLRCRTSAARGQLRSRWVGGPVPAPPRRVPL